MAKSTTFEFEAQQNSVDLLYDDDDIMIVSMDIFHVDGEGECNRNKCNISMKTAMKAVKSFYNKPIIARFNSNYKDLVTDVTEHAHNEEEAFEMRVVGHIPSDARIRFIERDNGKTYCNVEGVIQKKYLPQLVDILEDNDGELKVSIEIKARGESNDDDVFVIDSFILQGVCLLSPTVMEGIENSHLKVVKFSQQDIDTMNEKYMVFSKTQKSDFSIYDELKFKKEEKLVMNSMGVNDLRDQLWSQINDYKYHDGNWDGNKYFIEEIYPDDKDIILRDNETAIYYKVPYIVEGAKVMLKLTDKVEVEKGWHERPDNEKRFTLVFAKEEYGSGKEIKVDKSEKAVSDKAWGEVDKTELRHKVLNAKNYKTLVYDVYLEVEEGWEDSPSEKLKYPVMLIEGDTAVYSRYGLASALGYAKATNNTKVVNKVEELYRTINIDEKEDKMDGEQELQNKIDADNPEIEKIKDDADAMEDNEKEKLRDEEQKNAVVDAPENDKLKDDVASDKDYWEKKYNELESVHKELVSAHNALATEYERVKADLGVFQAKEDKRSMRKYLESFKSCFSSDEFNVMAEKIETCAKVDFEKEVDDKVKEFVKKTYCGKMSCDDDDDEFDIKNSAGFMRNDEKTSSFVGETKLKTLDDVLGTFKNL